MRVLVNIQTVFCSKVMEAAYVYPCCLWLEYEVDT